MNWGARHVCICAAAAAMLLPAAPIASAATREQMKACLDAEIQSCTAIIEQPQPKPGKKQHKSDKTHDVSTKDKAEAYFNRGMIFRDRGEADPALQDLEQAAKYNPKNSVALSTLSHIYYDKRDYQHAIDVLNQAIKLNSNFALAY
jgi:tetratricopeptide (TPR) repeat protein